jgi:hypothetical protein
MTAPRTIEIARNCGIGTCEGTCRVIYIDPAAFRGDPFCPDLIPINPTKAAEIVALLIETYGPGILPPATEPA